MTFGDREWDRLVHSSGTGLEATSAPRPEPSVSTRRASPSPLHPSGGRHLCHGPVVGLPSGFRPPRPGGNRCTRPSCRRTPGWPSGRAHLVRLLAVGSIVGAPVGRKRSGAIWVLIGAPPRDRDPGQGAFRCRPSGPLRHPDAPVDAVPVRVPRTVGRSASAAHVAPDAIRDGDGVAWNVPASAEGPRSPIRVRRCRTAMCPPGIRRRSTRRSRPRKRV
jgi:hypothetical protein